MNLEEATIKAGQTADLLVQDIHDIASLLCSNSSREETMAWQYAMDALVAAQDLRTRVHRMI